MDVNLIKKLTLDDTPSNLNPPSKIVPKPLFLLADSQSLFCTDKEGVGAHPLLCGVADVLRKEKSGNGLKAAYIGALNNDMPEVYDLCIYMFECCNLSASRHIKQQLNQDDIDFINSCDIIVVSGGDIEAGATAFKSNGLSNIIPRRYQEGALIVGMSEGAVILSEPIWENNNSFFRLTKNILVGVKEDRDEWKKFKLKFQSMNNSSLRAIAIPRSGGLVLYDTTTAPSLEEDEEQKNLIKKHSQIPGFRRDAPTLETVSGPWLVKPVFHYAIEFNIQGEADPSLYYRMDILSFPVLDKEDDMEVGMPKQYLLKRSAQPPTKKDTLFVGPFAVHSVREQFTPTIEANGSLISLVDNADIIPGTYEGGFHIWDCGMELVEFMDQIGYLFKGAKVLELGCGYGVPGICAFKLGSSIVDFQDYNYEVISSITAQNVLLNLAEGQSNVNGELVNSKSRFFSGDWGLLFNGLLPQTQKEGETSKYNIILSSDTVYQQRCHKRLHELLEYILHPKGVVLLAGKKMYGPGGGIKQFVRYVNSRGVFEATRVKKRQVGKDGQGNSRWVVQLSFKGQGVTLNIAPPKNFQQ